MRKLINFSLLALATGGIAAGASGAVIVNQQQISLSSSANIDLNTAYTNGGYYPKGGSTVTIGGINFTLASYGSNGDAGVVSTSFNGTPASVAVAVANLTNVSTLYALVDSAFGIAGQTIGSIDLGFSNGSTYSYALTEGVNIRDHLNGDFNNSATGLYGTANYSGNLRLDAVAINVPISMRSLALSSVTLRNTNPNGGEPFLAGLTVTSVPEPATWATAIGGFSVIGAGMRRRRAARSLA